MNSIIHFEIPSQDKERFKKFYGEVFGWTFIDMPEMNYTIVYTSEIDENRMPKTAGAVNGGMMSAEENGGLFPVLVIDVPNIDTHIEKLVQAGGEVIMPKHAVGNMGFYARFKDPEGVVMGIWETVQG